MTATRRRPAGSSIIAVVPSYTASGLDTTSCVSSTHSRLSLAPIAEYNLESTKLRRYTTPASFDPDLANYILLGQISLAESYFRSIVRRIIIIDRVAHAEVANHKVSYAAAHYLSKDMIPESLLENTSLASSHNLKETMRNLLGIKGAFNDIEAPISEFGQVCQLRHCIIHRFSYLGSANAAILGIESHGELIEKPIVFTYGLLQDAFQVVDVCVRSVNNFLFTNLVYRMADNNEWSWIYNDDWRKFDKYYKTFVDPTEVGCMTRRDAYSALEIAKK